MELKTCSSSLPMISVLALVTNQSRFRSRDKGNGVKLSGQGEEWGASRLKGLDPMTMASTRFYPSHLPTPFLSLYLCQWNHRCRSKEAHYGDRRLMKGKVDINPFSLLKLSTLIPPAPMDTAHACLPWLQWQGGGNCPIYVVVLALFQTCWKC